MPISVLSIAVAALILGAAGGALAARALKASRRNAAETAAMDNLLQQVDRSSQSLTGSIGTVREETRAAIQEKFVQVTERLGDLKATNERIMEFSRSLDEF